MTQVRDVYYEVARHEDQLGAFLRGSKIDAKEILFGYGRLDSDKFPQLKHGTTVVHGVEGCGVDFGQEIRQVNTTAPIDECE